MLSGCCAEVAIPERVDRGACRFLSKTAVTVLDSLILELDKALRTVFALTSAFRAVLSE